MRPLVRSDIIKTNTIMSKFENLPVGDGHEEEKVSVHKINIAELAEELKLYPDFDEVLQEKALEYLKNKDSDWFYSRFSGEVSSEGYLLDNDGNETNFLPSQNLGGPAYGEVIREVANVLSVEEKEHVKENNTE